jgi:integrase
MRRRAFITLLAGAAAWPLAARVRSSRRCRCLRHTVAGLLDAAGVRQTDAARILGHAVEGESFGTYSDGPGLKVLAGVIEAIRYSGLKLSTAS